MIKFVLGWLAVLVIRLIPGRPANFEPMLATIMPYSAHYPKVQSFLFGFLGIIVFDLISSQVGLWTIITAITYGAIGLAAALFFKKYSSSITNFVIFGFIGTIIFDAITGLGIGPIFYGQPFMEALVGQIPFTLMHLLGTTIFALTLSPLISRFVVRNDKLETRSVLATI